METLSKQDLQQLNRGEHWYAYDVLGAHTYKDSANQIYTNFVVWAPHALAISVVGDFNSWNTSDLKLSRIDESEYWSALVRKDLGSLAYKYAITTRSGELHFKIDPMAQQGCVKVEDGSVIQKFNEKFKWTDTHWMRHRTSTPRVLSVYEVDLASWKSRMGHTISYAKLADQLIDYALEMGFTHIEILPLTEFPYGGSWGYQVTGMFSPTSRYGSPDELRAFINAAHVKGLGVILDWVSAHFAVDAYALSKFDGESLYESSDPEIAKHPIWGTYVYDFSNAKVVNFLIASALYWVREFHFDGIRFDAVESIINAHFGKGTSFNKSECMDFKPGIAFIKKITDILRSQGPEGLILIAENSAKRPDTTASTSTQYGLGFDYAMCLLHTDNAISYLSLDFERRKNNRQLLLNSSTQPTPEHFILSINHDELSLHKPALLSRMYGDEIQRYENLKLLISWQWFHPGAKLLFMGAELGATVSWNPDAGLDWEVLHDPRNAGIQRLVRDLNKLYKQYPAFQSTQKNAAAMAWMDCELAHPCLFGFQFLEVHARVQVFVLANMSSQLIRQYRLPAGQTKHRSILFRSDSSHYGQSPDHSVKHIRTDDLINSSPEINHIQIDIPELTLLVVYCEFSDDATEFLTVASV